MHVLQSTLQQESKCPQPEHSRYRGAYCSAWSTLSFLTELISTVLSHEEVKFPPQPLFFLHWTGSHPLAPCWKSWPPLPHTSAFTFWGLCLLSPPGGVSLFFSHVNNLSSFHHFYGSWFLDSTYQPGHLLLTPWMCGSLQRAEWHQEPNRKQTLRNKSKKGFTWEASTSCQELSRSLMVGRDLSDHLALSNIRLKMFLRGTEKTKCDWPSSRWSEETADRLVQQMPLWQLPESS